jgi:hypothetical protein
MTGLRAVGAAGVLVDDRRSGALVKPAAFWAKVMSAKEKSTSVVPVPSKATVTLGERLPGVAGARDLGVGAGDVGDVLDAGLAGRGELPDPATTSSALEGVGVEA